MACFKRKKERDVAPTRGQFPCPAFGPHGASLSAWVCLDFFLDLFSSFLFFLCPFLLVSQSKRAISPALSVWTPSHMRTVRNLPAASARKSLGRFITLILTWCGHDGWIVDISFRVRFSNDHCVRKWGTLQKMANVTEAADLVVVLVCLANEKLSYSEASSAVLAHSNTHLDRTRQSITHWIIRYFAWDS